MKNSEKSTPLANSFINIDFAIMKSERIMKKKKDDITKREADVLKLVVKGLGNKEIAKMLFITSHTVKAHLSQIYKKLGVTNRTAAAIKAEEIIRHQDLKRP